MTNSDTSYKSDMSIDERVMMAILRVAERFKRESAAISKNYGLTFPQYNVLRILDASENGQNTIKNVNRIMLVSGANLTGITKRLDKMGFIIKKNDPKDDRLKWLEITAKGRQVLKNISEEKELNMKKYVKQYSDEEKSKILSVMKGILKSE
ncbi:MAG: winged helix DNA-binding protein [Deltaproteobacteria bacterium]|nr:winged helix DNA-binding protein [Deltaproteobacteria bacterium]